MAFDFLRFVSPEVRARIEARRASHERDIAEVRAMDDKTLCETTERYLANCQFPFQWQPGEPVYDGVVAHVIIPELVRRLRKGQP